LSFHLGLKVIPNSPGCVTSLLLGSPVLVCHLSPSGQACSAVFPLWMMEHLYRNDSVPTSSLVRAGCKTGRWGWGLGTRVYWMHSIPIATIWRGTKKTQIKLVMTCNKNEQQDNAKSNAEL